MDKDNKQGPITHDSRGKELTPSVSRVVTAMRDALTAEGRKFREKQKLSKKDKK